MNKEEFDKHVAQLIDNVSSAAERVGIAMCIGATAHFQRWYQDHVDELTDMVDNHAGCKSMSQVIEIILNEGLHELRTQISCIEIEEGNKDD